MKSVELKETPEPHQAEVIDLMERLRQSLEGTAGARKGVSRRSRKKTAGAKRKRAA